MTEKIRSFWKQLSAKKHILGAVFIFVLMILASISTILIPIVKADEGGTETYVGDIDAGDWATLPGMQQTSGFFYYNSTGAYIITLGGYGYMNPTEVVTDDIVRTTIDNTGGSVANTSTLIGNLYSVLYSAGIVFDWINRTFYIMGGFDNAVLKNTVAAFSLDNNTCWDTGANIPYLGRSWSPEGIWYNETCYIFGGRSAGDEWHGDVMCYKPSNNTAWKQHTLTSYGTGVNDPAVAYDGTSDFCYIFGGAGDGVNFDKIVCYRFANNSDWPVATYSRITYTTGLGVAYNDLNGTYIIGPSRDDNNISWWNTSIGTTAVTINNHSHSYVARMIWDNRTDNKTAYLFSGGHYDTAVFGDILKLDGFGTGEEPAPGPGASSFSLKGLPNNRVTWSGTVGTSVWCNNSGDAYETLEINLTVNSSDNITELRVWVGDLNDTSAWVNASNISVVFSSDNSTWAGVDSSINTTSFTDTGSNASVNTTRWTHANGMYGNNPFTYGGITDKNISIWCRFKLTIPSGASADDFWASSSTAWKVYIGYYT